MERIDRDMYRLSSGRKVTANHGLISLAADFAAPFGYGADAPFAGFEIGEGYDGHLSVDYEGDEWTAEELEELADFMVEQWQLFRSAICKAKAHDWSPWRGGFSDPFGIKGKGTQFFQHRNCRRCNESEELPDR